MPNIVQTNQLTKIIDGKELMKNVNIHVKKGEVYGFLGPNGAGKTTVMKNAHKSLETNLRRGLAVRRKAYACIL